MSNILKGVNTVSREERVLRLASTASMCGDAVRTFADEGPELCSVKWPIGIFDFATLIFITWVTGLTIADAVCPRVFDFPYIRAGGYCFLFEENGIFLEENIHDGIFCGITYTIALVIDINSSVLVADVIKLYISCAMYSIKLISPISFSKALTV